MKSLDNPNFKDKQLLTDLSELFVGRADIVEFLLEYGNYIETIDDCVDEPKDLDRDELRSKQAATLFNMPLWKKWGHALYAVERLIANTYYDSVRWETATEEWKRRDAKVLSHAGYNMLFAVILLEYGEDSLKKFSLRFRAHAHERHLHDTV